MLSDEELDVINQAIYNRYRLDFFNYEKNSFKRRVHRIIDKFELESVYGLWQKILRDPDFIHVFINEITVGLTELFRNPGLWKYIKDDLLAQLPPREQIKIWHAGCSTGEEFYSMAIALYESGLFARSQSLATDLSSNAVDKSQRGFYSQDLLKKYYQNYQEFTDLERDLGYYLEEHSEGATFKRYLRQHGTFAQHNLSKDPMKEKFDLIFCRNVMIYFDDVLKLKVLNLFYESLEDHGFFIMGYYDALPPFKNQFFELHNPAYKIFKKRL